MTMLYHIYRKVVGAAVPEHKRSAESGPQVTICRLRFTPLTTDVAQWQCALMRSAMQPQVCQPTRCRGVKPFQAVARSSQTPSNLPAQLSLLQRVLTTSTAAAAVVMLAGAGADARLEGVNKPELLPNKYTPVIDVAGFLTDGEEQRLRREVEALEQDTGVKLRVLAQNYPQTPGLAIKDFWGVDADTVVFVADPNTGNILNFNVGGNVDLLVPRSFWSRLAGKYGTKFYWQNNGENVAITNAVSAIDTCLREPAGKFKCSKVQEPFDQF